MTDNFRPAPDEWQCHVFIAVVETGGTEAAARRLGEWRPSYTRQSVDKVIESMEKWAGEKLLSRELDRKLYPTRRGQEILEAARNVVAQYRVMRRQSSQRRMPCLACLPHHTHFVAIAEDLLRDGGTEQIEVEYLGLQHRGEGEFVRRAVSLLQDDTYQLIIGPPVVRDSATLVSHRLYHAQLEAMVAHDFPAQEISLSDLVTQHRMLLPPSDMRSRRVLEESIVKWGVDDPGPAVRVAGETYETATSVMRLRNESRHGERASRVVVVPSDVALAYKVGMEFGGRNADRFRWVPIFHRDDDGQEHLLRMEVCVTVRRSEAPRLAKVIRALEAGIRMLDATAGRAGLSGEPFRGRRPNLGQRPPAG